MTIWGLDKHIKELRFVKEELNQEKDILYRRADFSKRNIARIQRIRNQIKCIEVKIIELKHTARHIRLKRLKGIK